MTNVARFEPYAAPRASIAVAFREVDDTVGEVAALRRDNTRLRRAAANALAAAEAERAESARLRRLATAPHCETCGQPIENLRGIWQHTASRLIACQSRDDYPIEGHAYPDGDLALVRDAITAAAGFYDCPCGSEFELAADDGVEDYAALNRWLGEHFEPCKWRMSGENQRLAGELATANALRTVGMGP